MWNVIQNVSLTLKPNLHLHFQKHNIKTNSLCCNGVLRKIFWFLQVNQKKRRNHPTLFLIKKKRSTEATAGFL